MRDPDYSGFALPVKMAKPGIFRARHQRLFLARKSTNRTQLFLLFTASLLGSTRESYNQASHWPAPQKIYISVGSSSSLRSLFTSAEDGHTR